MMVCRARVILVLVALVSTNAGSCDCCHPEVFPSCAGQYGYTKDGKSCADCAPCAGVPANCKSGHCKGCGPGRLDGLDSMNCLPWIKCKECIVCEPCEDCAKCGSVTCSAPPPPGPPPDSSVQTVTQPDSSVQMLTQPSSSGGGGNGDTIKTLLILAIASALTLSGAIVYASRRKRITKSVTKENELGMSPAPDSMTNTDAESPPPESFVCTLSGLVRLMLVYWRGARVTDAHLADARLDVLAGWPGAM